MLLLLSVFVELKRAVIGRQLLKVDVGPAGCIWTARLSSAEWRHRANGQLHTTCEVRSTDSFKTSSLALLLASFPGRSCPVLSRPTCAQRSLP